MVPVALAAADAAGADVEVIDLLSLWPWDRETILRSVERTGRVVTLEEAPMGSGWGGDVVSAIVSELFGKLKAPPLRITLPDAPVPYNGGLEARYVPSPPYVRAQIDSLVSTGLVPAAWWKEAS
jgi:pyruvate dehydrogenase E1 component beta subunit